MAQQGPTNEWPQQGPGPNRAQQMTGPNRAQQMNPLEWAQQGPGPNRAQQMTGPCRALAQQVPMTPLGLWCVCDQAESVLSVIIVAHGVSRFELEIEPIHLYDFIACFLKPTF